MEVNLIFFKIRPKDSKQTLFVRPVATHFNRLRLTKGSFVENWDV